MIDNLFLRTFIMRSRSGAGDYLLTYLLTLEINCTRGRAICLRK